VPARDQQFRASPDEPGAFRGGRRDGGTAGLGCSFDALGSQADPGQVLHQPAASANGTAAADLLAG